MTTLTDITNSPTQSSEDGDIIVLWLMAVVLVFAFLAGMFIFQVAHATNESSYKYGYQQGKSEFASCDIGDADCGAASDVSQQHYTYQQK